MYAAALKAFNQLWTPPFRSVLFRSLGLTLALLIAAIVAIQTTFGALVALPGWVEWMIQIAGGLGLIVGSVFLVAPITSLIAGLYLDDVAAEVERVHYPRESPGRELGAFEGLGLSLKFGLVVIAVNIGVLFVLLLPGINIMAFFLANGYLLGREYFELAAMRYVRPSEARELRRANRVRVLFSGFAIAGMVTVPLLNLLTPLFATALMVHTVKDALGQRPR